MAIINGKVSLETEMVRHRNVALVALMLDSIVLSKVPPPYLAPVVAAPKVVERSLGAMAQVVGYGRVSNGDSTAVAVRFSATGGRITERGLYSAGSEPGAYRIVATADEGPADTVTVTLTAPSPLPETKPSRRGIPYGAFGLHDSKVSLASLNLGHDPYTASNIIGRINRARANRVTLLLAMTGGAHKHYMTNGVFDQAKWDAKMETFNTPAIREAVANGVADGTIIGASVMDEPNVSGQGDGNTWGPKGTMTKARVDSLCAYVKGIFPTLPAAVVQRHDQFEPTKSYEVCDFIVSQYSSVLGNVEAFRNAGLAQAKREGISIAFSMNILDGGSRRPLCVGTGGTGTYGRNCRMTADQVREYGTVLAAGGCALFMWRQDDRFMADPDNRKAFAEVAALAASQPARSCRRP